MCFFVAAMAWWFERALVFAPRGDLRGGSTSPGFETVGAVAATRLRLRSRDCFARESQGESRVRCLSRLARSAVCLESELWRVDWGGAGGVARLIFFSVFSVVAD